MVSRQQFNPSTRKALSSAESILVFVMLGVITLVFFPQISLVIDGKLETTNTVTYYIVFIACTGMLSLFYFDRAWIFWRSPLGLWFIGIFALHLIALWRIDAGLIDSGMVALDQRTPVMFSMRNLVMMPAIILFAYLVGIRRFDRWMLVLAFCVPVTILISFFNPELFAVDQTQAAAIVRAAGTFGNANSAAEAAVFSLLCLHKRMDRRLLIFLYVLTGLAVLVTFSRSGQILWLALGIYMMLTSHYVARTKVAMVVAILCSPLIVSVVVPASKILDPIEDQLTLIYNDSRKAEAMMNRVTFLKPSSDLEQWDPYNQEQEESRVEIALEAFSQVLKKPFLGWGVTYIDLEHNAQPHNIIITFWYTFGLAGLLMWGWFVYILSSTSFSRGIIPFHTVIFLFLTFFNHNLFHHAYWSVLFAYFLLDVTDGRILGYRSKDSSARRIVFSSRNSSSSDEGFRVARKRKKRRRSGAGKSQSFRF